MGFLNLLSLKAPNRFFLAVVLGAIAGVLYALLIPLILSAIAPADPAFATMQTEVHTVFGIKISNYALAAVFFSTCFGILCASSLSEIMLLRIGSDCGRDIRENIYRQISLAPIEAIERIGLSKLIASINIDVPRIITGARIMPLIFVNLVTLTGMLGFLIYLNIEVFKFVMMAILCGALIYQLPISIGKRFFSRSREANDAAQESVRGLIFGAKELKLDSDKQAYYLKNVLLSHEQQLVSTEKVAYTITTATVGVGELLSFFVIGSIIFVFSNYYPIDTQTLVAVIMVLLYVTGPIGLILNSLPNLAVAAVAYNKVNNLMADIPKEQSAICEGNPADWRKLTLSQVVYSYQGQSDEQGFEVGPIDLEFQPGSLTFIVGGNGSGKSTLSKLLTMLYLPHSGEVYCDDELVTVENINNLRKQIFAIFSDYFLFNQLLIEVTEDVAAQANMLLKKLHLDHKVTLKDGHFSTTSLSDGQRKRLSLLVAIVENKQLYMFDEWAADQDPEFRHLFYTEILPELKRKGKTVVVISHDDRYFNVADQLVVMEQGKVATINPHKTGLAS
ncbi:cyclic peptide export ABC transporter [Pseudoalteromonas rubra]|uniref:Cyclic peptide export ABC transporter n=1 Tax=Pseudoalteromonas rubra TaxID=43658 RepID=A0A4Q7E2R7_9GAMM|nr:cyclic peptide export ABC transporter [Pseudoalteromonas rubra]RZM76720.1 cyclic peptide export ABC transporter [Pseudoalteromonas rubra]